jgi:hypothetical protein
MQTRISLFDPCRQESACEDAALLENQFQHASYDEQADQKNDADNPEKNLHVIPLKK